MSTKDHPGAEYKPDLGPQTHLAAEIATHQLGKIATLLDLAVEKAVLRFDADALRIGAKPRSDTKRVWIEETSIEYTTDHHEFSVAVDTAEFRKKTRIRSGDETTKIQFRADRDERTAHSGDFMGYFQLLDPETVSQPDEDRTELDWSYEGVVEAKHLKMAVAGVTDCTGQAFHLLGKGELGVRGKSAETGEYDRYEPVPAQNSPDGLGHVFLETAAMAPILRALPMDETVTVRLGEWMPVEIETEGGTTIRHAPWVSGENQEERVEAILSAGDDDV